jgi:hypothetical protein
MSNYTKATNFAIKDSLSSGNANKIIKGTDLNTEFDNIAAAINSKLDVNNSTLLGYSSVANLTITETFTATVDGGTY